MENEAKLLETTTPIIISNNAEFGYPLKFVTIYYRKRDLTMEVCFRNKHASKMRFLCVNFDLYLFFQGLVVIHSAAGAKSLGINSPVARTYSRFNSQVSTDYTDRQAVLAMRCTVATNCDRIMQCS